MNDVRIFWETLDFKPDSSLEAWYFHDDEPDYFRSQIVGWEIQAETILNQRTGAPIEDQSPLTERPRQYVMIDIDSYGITGEVDGIRNLWKVMPAGSPAPADKELRAAWSHWKTGQVQLQRIRQNDTTRSNDDHRPTRTQSMEKRG